MKRPSAPRTMRSTLMASASSTTPRRKTKARSWLASLYAEGKAGPYTINRCLDDYIADYKRRGGKALDRLEITANAFIRPELGWHEVAALTRTMIRNWHAAL